MYTNLMIVAPAEFPYNESFNSLRNPLAGFHRWVLLEGPFKIADNLSNPTLPSPGRIHFRLILMKRKKFLKLPCLWQLQKTATPQSTWNRSIQ